MATKKVVTLECDYDTSTNLHDDSVATHVFTLDGEAMEMDLCAKHTAMFTRAMAPFTVRARRVETPPRAVVTMDGQSMWVSVASAIVQRRRGRPPGSKNGTHTPPPLSDAAKVRAWARSNGYIVPDRGRIASSVTTAYAAANA
jgi:hypothetical protein